MCLNFKRDNQLGRFAQAFKENPNQRIKAWKVLNRINGDLWSTAFPTRWHPGWKRSTRQSRNLTDNEFWNDRVLWGIHVFLNEDDVRSYRAKRYAVLEVRCVLRDLVGAGRIETIFNDGEESAVFMKVWVPPREFYRATGEHHV